MNQNDCFNERLSTRTIGVFILPFGLLLAFASFFFIPIFGLIFALPILLLATAFIAAPESKACRLLSGKST